MTVGPRAFFVLIALALCAGYATQAQAACGDWLSHTNLQTDQDRAAPVQAPRGCSGPACQQSPAQEPRSPLSEGTIVVDKAALTAESLSDLVAESPDGFARPVSDRRLPNLFCSHLERPPRS
jgi:hypothetical protein